MGLGALCLPVSGEISVYSLGSVGAEVFPADSPFFHFLWCPSFFSLSSEDSCDSQFKVPQDDLIILLCGLFASSNIIFSHPSWGRQETLNFSCATRKALVNWCFHYLTGLRCHFHFLLTLALPDTSLSELMVWRSVVVMIPSTWYILLPLPLFFF